MKLHPYILLPFLVTGCASQAVEKTTNAAANESAEKVLAVAIATNKEANKLGYEWRDTGKWIKKAQAALKAGKEAEALKLAKKIKAAAKDGIQQAADQKNAGPLF